MRYVNNVANVEMLPMTMLPIANERKTAMKKLMMVLRCAAMVSLVVEDAESYAFLREGVDLS